MYVLFVSRITLDWCTDFLLSTLLIGRYNFFLFAQVVLSACSSYFQKLLLSNPCKHPTIIMPQDVCFNDLKFIIEFVYRGEIDVSQAELQVSQCSVYICFVRKRRTVCIISPLFFFLLFLFFFFSFGVALLSRHFIILFIEISFF